MFVFLDLETGGIPSKEYPLSEIPILEVAIVVTGDDLVELAHKQVVISQPEYKLEGMGDWAKEHHTKTGLLAASRSVTLAQGAAGLQLTDWLYSNFLYRHGADGSDLKPPMCGNSIHYDRKFLEEHMPQLASLFHYRNIDVSTLKELGKAWGIPPFEKEGGVEHRALDDVRHSIDELAHYRQYFNVGDSK